MSEELYCSHVSVDCSVFGFDGKDLKVLLVERTLVEDREEYHDMKLPGSLIFQDEDLDGAALRVLAELTGIKNVYLNQFKCFGSISRTGNPKDVLWLERATHAKIGRIVTVAYMSLIRIDRRLKDNFAGYKARWCSVRELPDLAFDHNEIILEAIRHIRRNVKFDPAILFELLPSKFTASELRSLYEAVYNEDLDVRNFGKKMLAMEYVVKLDETQQNVSHRAARYYKFNKKIYNKLFKNK